MVGEGKLVVEKLVGETYSGRPWGERVKKEYFEEVSTRDSFLIFD